MEEKRAKTITALSAFIDTQKALLQRTQTDITRLKQLRAQILETTTDSFKIEPYQEEIGRHKLSDHPGVVLAVPQEVDWSLLGSCDPAPFKSLATSIRNAQQQERQPTMKQTSPLSALQQFVKTARATIIDPVLESLPPLSSDEEDEPPDPEERRRQQEREKIRELKRRRVHGGSRYSGLSGLGLRKADADAVYVREDQEDESAEVDIGWGSSLDYHPGPSRQVKMEVDAQTLELPLNNHTPSKQAGRSRRPSRKVVETRTESTPKPPPKSEESVQQDEGPKLDKRGKPRPETYKQAWSVEEQHLLERLLEEIPEGEKNRWSKISQAMNGRRTPRQVASRVQKYYEKLKRFGLEVGNGAGRSSTYDT